MDHQKLLQLAEQAGFEHSGELNIEALVLRQEVRDMCADNTCRRYGKCWSCPPACGSLEAIRRRIRKYTGGILLQTTRTLRDNFDVKTMLRAEQIHKDRFHTLSRQARILYPDCLPMAAGSCTICQQCTYPDRPCRFPDRMFPSMEACGLVINDVCRDSGMPYDYGAGTITYTSCILTC
ncbi:Predicted metal-binding protein [Eubacterium pyruvativorans]|uniref:Predicted metal-binding protein n=1 Tax=Eubacterium pyruvativorans TaxID=155865 RepID=A0A1I7FE90_9FIRM|nr:DUF2284 domain-containing protein [Eubacterium pyruvativorans]SFN84989.1 Predicted metal-binding protein [Eubacterium pyruvativorans]SFU34461.1 Predicted metal-binding protein [Eubacterium pyruvativorans]HAT83211.1 DUF2284 domain-containing protein [Eubacterium sp.]